MSRGKLVLRQFSFLFTDENVIHVLTYFVATNDKSLIVSGVEDKISFVINHSSRAFDSDCSKFSNINVLYFKNILRTKV